MGSNKTNTYDGYAGKLLRVELGSLKVIEEPLDMKTARDSHISSHRSRIEGSQSGRCDMFFWSKRWYESST